LWRTEESKLPNRGSAGLASYQAAKFAIDGFSRVLRAETAPFGIKVLVVEPSGFATDWAGSSMTVHEVPDSYASTVGAMNSLVRHTPAGAAGDPDRAAQILVQIARRADIPEHLPLGVHATEASIAADRKLLDDDLTWRPVSRSADYGEPYPVPFPPDSAA
jgi:NAD(P)-dependent dehydrogenase (short-subunit alcohol dehydrogenase family)